MLCLGRKLGEAIVIDGDFTIRVLVITGYSVKLEITDRRRFAIWQSAGCLIEIDESTNVIVDKILSDRVKFAIEALPHISVHREEVAKKIKAEAARMTAQIHTEATDG